MPPSLRPLSRPMDVIPHGPEADRLFVLCDPDGFSEPIILPHAEMVLWSLMDGQRTWAQIQSAFQSRLGTPVSLARIERLIGRLDDSLLLAGERFQNQRRMIVKRYLDAPTRPARHAGTSYEPGPDDLRRQLAASFSAPKGPGPINSRAPRGLRTLRGVVSPHIDLYSGAPAYAWAYKAIVEQTDADLFVIIGTAHQPMREPFSVSRKDFDTPLGVVRADGPFISRLARHLASNTAGGQIDPFADEAVHRFEHSIELQAIFLQYALGPERRFRIVPVLAKSLQPHIDHKTSPHGSPEFRAFLKALRSVSAEHAGGVCFIGAADLAHIGRRFGDPHILDDKRLAWQSADDRLLLEAACRSDANGLFDHVAQQVDRNRICGLAPIYTLLRLLYPARGNLLTYDQAVEPDGTSCVSFASLSFHEA